MIRWIDMVDPVYTLCNLAGVDPDENEITGIAIHSHNLIVWYIDANGVRRHVSKRYDI